LGYATPITVVWLRFAMGVVILGLAVTLRGQFSKTALPTLRPPAHNRPLRQRDLNRLHLYGTARPARHWTDGL
jgi:hypothetical protein